MIHGVTDGARARFWAGLGGVRRTDLGRLSGWETRLDAALDEPARTWRSDWLARDAFAAELASRLNDDDEEVVSWWDHLRPTDLYLACACARGVAGEQPGMAEQERAARALRDGQVGHRLPDRASDR